MERWRKVWREGIVPHISTVALEALAQALQEDDMRLIQGATTSPPPLQACIGWPADAACVLGFCGMADGLVSVDEIEEYFARVCFDADQVIGEPAGCRFFFNWYDKVDRGEMRRELGEEVQRELDNRKAGE